MIDIINLYNPNPNPNSENPKHHSESSVRTDENVHKRV